MLSARPDPQPDDSQARRIKGFNRALWRLKLGRAAKLVGEGIEETFSYCSFPSEHWRQIRTNNPLERVLRGVRRRTRVVGCFPDGRSALMLVCGRLRHVSGTKWGLRRYMRMERLKEAKEAAAVAV